MSNRSYDRREFIGLTAAGAAAGLLLPGCKGPVPPPEVKPPRCRSGHTITVDFPIRLACTAAITPADVPP